MFKDIYATRVPHLQVKAMHKKIENVTPVIVSRFPQDNIDNYNRFILCCDLMHTNGFNFINMVSQGIIFGPEITIKNHTIKKLEYGIKQVNNIYIQKGL